jgi:hypothetical protein
MPLLETHVRLPCTGIGALGLLRLASRRGSPGRLYVVAPSVKKSTYFEPTIRTSLSTGLLLREVVPCAWLTDEVASELLAVDIALSVPGAAIVVAVVEARGPSATVLEVDVKDVEYAVSGGAVAAPSSVEVALVDVAVSAATKSVLKVPTMMRLARRTLAAENAIVCAFIQLIY